MALNEPRKIPPEWYAVRLDETQYCSPEFVARCGGKVWGVYLVDVSVLYYACTATPTYSLRSVGIVAEAYPDDEDAAEQLDEELRQIHYDSPESSLVDLKVVDNLPDDQKDRIEVDLSDEDDDWEDGCFDTILEAYNGNPSW